MRGVIDRVDIEPGHARFDLTLTLVATDFAIALRGREGGDEGDLDGEDDR